MDGDHGDAAAVESVDTGQVDSLESYMDVVMTYKCKLCNFTSNQPQNIATHVRSKHIAAPVPTSTDSPVFKPRHHFPQKSSAVQTLIISPDDGSGDITVQMSSESDFPVEGSLTNDNAVKKDNWTRRQVPVSSISGDIISGGTPTEIRSPLSETGSGNRDLEANRAASQIDIEMECVVPAPNTSTSGHTITRELFLCGQCSIGYNTMEECKLHMLQTHNSILPTSDCTTLGSGQGSEQCLVGPEKVSVGTQVHQRKKPGRKPKGYYDNLPAETSKDEEYTVVIGGTRSRPRRIKTPKSHQQDFLWDSTKKKSRDMGHLNLYSFKCQEPACYARFKTNECLDLHQKCHRKGEGQYGFQCCECMQVFTKWRELRFHFWRIHKIDTDLLSCEDCSFKTDTVHKLKTHREIHGEERPYTCNICEKGFKQLSQMHNHKAVHMVSTDPDKWYSSKQCETCKRTFVNQKCLAKHIQAVHCKVKPFVCSLCGYSASRKAMIQLHMRRHTGEKPFKCDMCPYVTGDHNSLRRHKMRHTGDKPYKCQFCPYACIQAISLKCHMKNKHPGMPGVYFCELCQFRTVNKENYANHQKDHENGLISVTRKPTSTTPEDTEEEVITIGVQDQRMELQNTEAQISEEDLAKLTANYEGLMPSDVSAAQLIYSALNAMSQNVPPAAAQQSTHVLEGVQTTISGGAEEDGVTTHTITFHIAPPEDQSAVCSGVIEQTGPVLLTPSIPVQLIQTGGQESTQVSLPYCTETLQTAELGTITVSEPNAVQSPPNTAPS